MRAFDEFIRLSGVHILGVVAFLFIGSFVAFFRSSYWGIVIGAFTVGYVIFRLITVFEGRIDDLPTFEAVKLIVLYLIAAGTCLALGKLSRDQNLKHGDQIRARLAQLTLEQAYESAKNGDLVNNTLYLRPFASTDQFRIRNPVQKTIGTPEFYEHDFYIDVERLFAEALSGSLPLVALGLPGEHFGAGRILTDDKQWKEHVRQLTSAVPVIVILPSHREGTQWEIDHIISHNYMHKTIWLMPPTSVKNRSDAAEYWGAAQSRTLVNSSLNLPGYSESGALFMFDSDLEIAQFECLVALSTSDLAETIGRFVEIARS